MIDFDVFSLPIHFDKELFFLVTDSGHQCNDRCKHSKNTNKDARSR